MVEQEDIEIFSRGSDADSLSAVVDREYFSVTEKSKEPTFFFFLRASPFFLCSFWSLNKNIYICSFFRDENESTLPIVSVSCL